MDPRGAHWQRKREQAGIPETKVCERCGSTYGRPRSLRTVSWLERRFCGQTCQRAALAERMAALSPEQRGRRPRRVWTEEELAERAVRERARAAERARAYRARHRTGRSPGRPRVDTGVPEEKDCAVCGQRFVRPRGRKQIPNAEWAARRFCSQSCYHADRVMPAGEEHPGWKGDDVVRATGNRRARVLYPELGQCNRCPAPAELRHHIDDDTLNNEPGNVEFLCRPCHVAHHDPVGSRWSK